MPNGEVDRLGNLTSVEQPKPMPETDRAAMQEMPARTAGPPTAGPQQGDGGEDAKVGKVGQLIKQLMDIAQEITQVDPRTVTIVQDTMQKMYLGISKIYGVEDEVKLRMKKAQGAAQTQGMNRMGGM